MTETTAKCACEKCECEKCECGCHAGKATTTTRVYIVGVDATETSQKLTRWMSKEVARPGDEVRLVHVIPGTYAGEDTLTGVPFVDYYPITVPDEEKVLMLFFRATIARVRCVLRRARLRYQSTPMLRQEMHEETAWRNDALKWIEANLAPILDKAQIDYNIDIVAYDTNSSSVGEILCEKATLLEDAVAVCVASTSKGRLKEFFIGSVCNYCLHRCKKPVIVFKPSDQTTDDEETAKEQTNDA